MKCFASKKQACRMLCFLLSGCMLLSSAACGTSEGGEADTVVTTTTTGATTTAGTPETTSTVTETVPRPDVPFTWLNEGESMLEWDYRVLDGSSAPYILRYGIFSTDSANALNGVGLYVDFLTEDLKVIEAYRYLGSAFLSIQRGEGDARDDVFVHAVSTSNDKRSFGGKAFQLTVYNMPSEETRVGVVDSAAGAQISLNIAHQHKLNNFLFASATLLRRGIGSEIVLYNDANGTGLIEDGSLLLTEADVTKVESASMADIAAYFGMEYKE